jgi:hypothetical protein
MNVENKKQTDFEKGFVSTIVLIVVALFILQYVFHVDVIGWIKSTKLIDWFTTLKNFLQTAWSKYIVGASKPL